MQLFLTSMYTSHNVSKALSLSWERCCWKRFNASTTSTSTYHWIVDVSHSHAESWRNYQLVSSQHYWHRSEELIGYTGSCLDYYHDASDQGKVRNTRQLIHHTGAQCSIAGNGYRILFLWHQQRNDRFTVDLETWTCRTCLPVRTESQWRPLYSLVEWFILWQTRTELNSASPFGMLVYDGSSV